MDTTMTSSKTHDILRKINYIEADVEIQRQVLFSIPSDQKEEMEKTIRIIAAKKEEIEKLRLEIKAIDPEEYQRIIVFEGAITEFKKMASERKFESIESKNDTGEFVLELKEGANPECLIKACDANGDWTIITMEGEIQNFPADAVAEKPKKAPLH